MPLTAFTIAYDQIRPRFQGMQFFPHGNGEILPTAYTGTFFP
jgi:hypothetical protein